MSQDANSNWFIDVEGQRVGPYTLEQLRGLLDDGEILPHFRVTTDRLEGEWITLDEVMDAHQIVANFQPPPRPSDLGSHPLPENTVEGSNATFDLFDALQAAKERKATSKLSAATASSGEWTNSASSPRQIPPQAWMIAAMVLILGSAIWGMSHLLKKKADAVDNVVVSNPRINVPVPPQTQTQTQALSQSQRAASNAPNPFLLRKPIQSAPVQAPAGNPSRPMNEYAPPPRPATTVPPTMADMKREVPDTAVDQDRREADPRDTRSANEGTPDASGNGTAPASESQPVQDNAPVDPNQPAGQNPVPPKAAADPNSPAE